MSAVSLFCGTASTLGMSLVSLQRGRRPELWGWTSSPWRYEAPTISKVPSPPSSRDVLALSSSCLIP